MTSESAGRDGVIGVDVGGTKTHLALGPAGGPPVAERIVRSSSWRSHDPGRNAAALHGLVREWLGEAALGRPLAVGAHGCDSTEQCLEFRTALSRWFTGGVHVVNDAELLAPAMGHATGIGLVAGTGCIAVTRDDAGRLLTAGGWGWVLGDEGGASGLVREAVRAVLGALDRGLPPDPLGTRLLAAFGAADGADLALAVTTSPSADWLGDHALEVFTAAAEGSELAAGVVDGAVEHLTTLVDRLIGRGVTARHLVAGGSVLLLQDRLRDAFLAAVAARQPRLTVEILDRPPVLGALALAGAMPTSPSGDPRPFPVGGPS
jgi:N-acetylglucosamine kinase-like BadF-type ATPase